MKNTIDRKSFIKALKTVKPGLANKELIEQSTHFAFMGDRVLTYNDYISISHPVPLDIIGAVEAKPFLKFLEADKANTLDIEAVDDKLILSGQNTAEFVFHPEIRLPLKELGTLESWRRIENPLRFFEALKFCLDTCSIDMSKRILTHVHVGSDFMESSDNKQYSYCEISDPLPVKPFLIPGTTVQDLSRYAMTDVTRIAETKGWVHFKNIKGTEFSARVDDEKYPDTAQIKEKIAATEQGFRIMWPLDTNQMIDQVSAVLSTVTFDIDKFITVTIGNKELKIESESESGKQSSKNSLRYAGDPVKFLIHPDYLKSALKGSHECFIAENMAVFKSHAGVRAIGFVPD